MNTTTTDRIEGARARIGGATVRMEGASARVEGASSHTVPLFQVSRLIELVQRWHIPPDELLAGSGLAVTDLEDPLGRLPISRMCALLERARLITGEPGLGYYRGLQMRASGYGTVGFATQSASCLGEALTLVLKFAPVFSTAITLDLRIEGSLAMLYLEENVDFGSARDIVLITLVTGLRTVSSTLTGRPDWGAVHLAIPEPEYQGRFAHLAQGWKFGRSYNRVVFDASALETPIVTSDPAGLHVVRTLCEHALDELAYDAGLVDSVRRLIRGEGRFRTLDDVASHLHVSERTLKRRLAAQGASFSELTERERQKDAIALLRCLRLSVAEVATRLGYSNESSFVRAFRRWTGTTPAAHRRERSAAWAGKQ
jgi:AraC-like DNA-binding protein